MLSSHDRGEVLQISPLLDVRENGESQDKARLASRKLTKKERDNTCRTEGCVSLSEEPSGGTAGDLLGAGSEAEVLPEGLWC